MWFRRIVEENELARYRIMSEIFQENLENSFKKKKRIHKELDTNSREKYSKAY